MGGFVSRLYRCRMSQLQQFKKTTSSEFMSISQSVNNYERKAQSKVVNVICYQITIIQMHCSLQISVTIVSSDFQNGFDMVKMKSYGSRKCSQVSHI